MPTPDLSYDVISLSAEVNFPNIEFSQDEINFGAILNDTETAVNIKMDNKGSLPVKYRWWFETDESGGIGKNKIQESKVRFESAPMINNERNEFSEDENDLEELDFKFTDSLTLENIFNISPLFGEIEPGTDMTTQFVFTAHSNIIANCRAICEVDGGPQLGCSDHFLRKRN
jgi:hydrocephalus-inducing protein